MRTVEAIQRCEGLGDVLLDQSEDRGDLIDVDLMVEIRGYSVNLLLWTKR